MTNLTTRFLVCLFCCFFILAGCAIIPYAGVQNDEAIFANPLYLQSPKDFSMTIFHRNVVLMVMSYIGTLKTLLFLPVFSIFGGNVWSLRLPMVVIGALTLFIFFHFTEKSANRTVALLAVALLATDPVYLLAETFDWGPVTLQHFLLVIACFCLVRFAQTSSRRDLGAGFFALGLAMWNKAVFGWTLAGLIVGALAVFWPEIRRALGFGNLAVAAAGFLIGALPFVVYNIRHPNATVSSNAHFETENFGRKLGYLENTANGSGLLGFIPAEDDAGRAPGSPLGRFAFWIHGLFGTRRTDGMVWAFFLSFLAIPWWWKSRAARFSLVFMVVSWLVMAFTRDAGGAVHHAILLWPFPVLFIAVALGSLPGRAIPVAAGTILVGMNLLVLNQHVYQFERNGAAGNFTDAIFGLSKTLKDPQNPAVEEPIYMMDWGMLNTLALFHQGRLLLRIGSDYDESGIRVMLSDPHALFVAHVPDREVIPGAMKRLDAVASADGRRKELVQAIPDSSGHPVFEIYRYSKL